MCIHLTFNYKKAVQALNFFANKDGGCINKMKAIKLIFFADRFHLRKYGRPIVNDEYFAMPYGPVCSGVKDIAEMSIWLGEKEGEYAVKYLRTSGKFEVEAIKGDPDWIKIFSKSDLEALSFSWDNYGKMSEFDLAETAHQYPEWKKHEKKLKTQSRARMNYEDFFEDPTEKIEVCYDLSSQDKKNGIEQIKEQAYIESLWS